MVTIAVVVSGYPLIGLVAGQIASSVANAAIAIPSRSAMHAWLEPRWPVGC